MGILRETVRRYCESKENNRGQNPEKVIVKVTTSPTDKFSSGLSTVNFTQFASEPGVGVLIGTVVGVKLGQTQLGESAH